MQVPSPSTLVYLFADRLIRPDTAFTTGTKVPCSDAKVRKKELATTLLAVAVSHLASEGAIDLRVEKRGFPLKRTAAVVEPRGSTRAGGLEGELAAQIGHDETVKRVVRDWFGSDVSDPWQTIIDRAAAAAVASGHMHEVDAERGKVSGFLLGRTKIEPDCDAIASLLVPFEEAAQRWRTLEDTQPELAELLVKGCSKAIASRQESDGGDVPGD